MLLLEEGISQQVSLQICVKDSITTNELVFSSVWIQRTRTGELTGLQGCATLKGIEPEDTIEVSYMGYEPQLIFGLDLLKKSLEIGLVPKSFDLASVVVLPPPERGGRRLVKKTIKRIDQNYIQRRVSREGRYTEITEDESVGVVEASQAWILAQQQAYPQRNYVRRAFREFWQNNLDASYGESSRLAPKIFRNYNSQYFKYYTSLDEKCAIRAARYYTGEKRKASPLMMEGPLNLLSLDKVKYQTDCLDPRLVSKYTYNLTSSVVFQEDTCYMVSFKPKKYTKRLKMPWGSKPRFPILAGHIYISKATLTILRIEYELHDVSDQYAIGEPWQEYPLSCRVQVIYRKLKNGFAADRIEVVQRILFEDVVYNITRKLELLGPSGNFGNVPGIIAEIRDGFPYKLRTLKVPEMQNVDWNQFIGDGSLKTLGIDWANN